MEINRIKLENIRSYTNQEINFKKGSTLLSGDIGSGKSTILLAIDFALFGLTRGILSGSSLLRNGEKKGAVELDFEVDGKHVIIRRTLKKEKTVSQDSGHIIIDGDIKVGTAMELKQKILELLNYPRELLTKNKALVYRYTVYTPQEEMKQILLSDKESRLDTLRRVFGIDKYKRVKENALLFLTNLRSKKNKYLGMIVDLKDKQENYLSKQKQFLESLNKIEQIKPELDEVTKKLENKKQEIKNIETKIKELNELKNDLSVNETSLMHQTQQRKKVRGDLEKLGKQLLEIKKELEEEQKGKVEQKNLEEKQNQIEMIEDIIKEISKKITESEIRKSQSDEIIKSIQDLDTCPTCKQIVQPDHKHRVVTIENQKITEAIKNIKDYQQKELESDKRIKLLKQELDSIREIENKIKLLDFKKQSLEEKEKTKQDLEQFQEELKNEVIQINLKRLNLNREFENFGDIEKTYENLRQELEQIQQNQREIELRKVSLEKEAENIQKIKKNLEIEIQSKLKIKETIDHLSQIEHWLLEFFIKLTSTIERKIMLRVYSDFDGLFQKWFEILIEDELLEIKLDEEFTPLIHQNGHQIDYNFLSGGEKTAAALSYRLALNQVINKLISVIKTKDLLILDEPTDGFSYEQLDRLKLVLDELESKQIILVSHEPKIESFVNNVIKLEKRNHITSIS